MSSSNNILRYMTRLLFVLAILFVIVWQAPAFYTVQGLASNLPLHMFAEIKRCDGNAGELIA
jgi:hypothetical protein